VSGAADAFHPAIQEAAVSTGVRWSRRVGYPGVGALLALASHPDRKGLVLAASGDDGSMTATSLTEVDAAMLRDALDAWLGEQA
jgi:hypothetical protein